MKDKNIKSENALGKHRQIIVQVFCASHKKNARELSGGRPFSIGLEIAIRQGRKWMTFLQVRVKVSVGFRRRRSGG